ncbi:MAG: type II toxin-antitoxin system mRNA interferase toxin, RelE/StbE family [Patescibacteria group bacterium]
MKIELHPDFKKSYRKRIKNNSKLVTKTKDRIEIYRENPSNSILKDHALKGSGNSIRAFSITGDFRIIYKRISKDHILFLDIGTHNQVY